MKKTLITLLALSSIAGAETLTLNAHSVSFGTSSTLQTGNKEMTWEDSQTYTNWYMEFSFTELVDNKDTIGNRWISTICSDNSTDRKGLAASVKLISEGDSKTPHITFSNGSEYNNLMGNSPTLTFSVGDALTMAVYNGHAYLGNKTTKEYISYDLSTLPQTEKEGGLKAGSDTTIATGAARAFANSDSTKIGNTTVASLDNLSISDGQTLDIATLVTTGKAETMPIPEPATATLSLLALCGLAARRRRK